MHVRVGDPKHLESLMNYLRGRGCSTGQTGPREARVSPSARIVDEAAFRAEVERYVAAWRAHHRGADAELVPG